MSVLYLSCFALINICYFVFEFIYHILYMSPVLAIGSSVKELVDLVVSVGKKEVIIIVEYLGVVGRGWPDF